MYVGKGKKLLCATCVAFQHFETQEITLSHRVKQNCTCSYLRFTVESLDVGCLELWFTWLHVGCDSYHVIHVQYDIDHASYMYLLICTRTIPSIWFLTWRTLLNDIIPSHYQSPWQHVIKKSSPAQGVPLLV